MFEVPAAKRVKRSQLFGSDGEDEDSSTVRTGDSRSKKADGKNDGDDDDAMIPDYGFEYDFVSPNEIPNSNSSSEPHKATASKPTNNDTETYQFNLFAPSRSHPSKAIARETPSSDPSSITTPATTSTSQPLPKPLQISISIRSPSPTLENSSLDPGTLVDPRPSSHYFTSALPPKTLQTLRKTYLSAAIDQLTLTKLSTLAWPGTHQPWRRITLPAHRKQVIIVRTKSAPAPAPPSSLHTATAAETGTNRHRARPSKKRRDLARTRAQKRQILIDESKTKEEHEREKKNKKNRERKLKRRAKERREKEAKCGAGGGGETGDGNVSMSDGDSVDGSAD